MNNIARDIMRGTGLLLALYVAAATGYDVDQGAMQGHYVSRGAR